jgi:hypothetical protein
MDRRSSKKIIFAPNFEVRCSLSELRMQQFRQAVLAVRYWQQSIYLREKNIVGPTGEIGKGEAFY